MWRREGGGSYDPRQNVVAGGAGVRAPRSDPDSVQRYVASSRAKHMAMPKSYFDDSDDEEVSQHAASQDRKEKDEEEDPLDAFMAGVEAGLKHSSTEHAPRPERLDEAARDEADDGLLARHRAQCEDITTSAKKRGQEEEEARFVDGKLVVEERKKKKIGLLEPVDHSVRRYEHVENALIDLAKWNGEWKGAGARPMVEAAELEPWLPWLAAAIARRGMAKPTEVQAKACPAALCGYDVLAIAPTGSGKTLAYGWPALAHAAAQRRSAKDEGPISLIVCPTRELSEQIYRELRKFAASKLDVVAVFGGAGKWEMGKALREGGDVCVATPGRLIELANEIKDLLQSRCTFLCVDEADRMFDLGFHDQLRSIAQAVRPTRQTMTCSATMRRDVETLASAFMRPPPMSCRVVVTSSSASPRIEEQIAVLPNDDAKLAWLQSAVPSLVASGKSIVFASRKKDVDDLVDKLRQSDMCVALGLHGDKDAHERSRIVAKYKQIDACVLVATDVAARGLDLKGVATVVNYDPPKDIETYVHRIGRAGRERHVNYHVSAAHTLLVEPKDRPFARLLVRRFTDQKLQADPKLVRLADLHYIPVHEDSGNRGFGAEIAPPPSYTTSASMAALSSPPALPTVSTSASDDAAVQAAKAAAARISARFAASSS